MQSDQSARRRALERLEAFVGEWTEQVDFPDAPPGRTVFEWLLGGSTSSSAPRSRTRTSPTASRSSPSTRTGRRTPSTTSTRAASSASTRWPSAIEMDARPRCTRLHAAGLLTAVQGHVRSRRQHDRRNVGVVQGRRALGARLRPHLHEDHIAGERFARMRSACGPS